MVIPHIIEQTRMIIALCTVVRVDAVWLRNSSFSFEDESNVLLSGIMDVVDDICCWTAVTDVSNEKIDRNEINIDVRRE